MVKLRTYFQWKHWRWVFAFGAFVGTILAIWVIVFVARASRDIPSIEGLAEYTPPVMSRVHAGDGKLIKEFKKEARVFVPIETVPRKLQYAFVAAEDQRFYQHDGFDEKGFARAMVANLRHKIKGERLEGGSTITQQVAKNFLVGSERTVERKVREIIIATRIEKALDKDHILELYLNEIYFGRGAYGVAAASLNYFGKPMKDLNLAEAAYLAVLPKAPNNYQVTNPDKKARALARRNYVLSRMIEDNYANKEEAEEAKEQDIEVVDRLEGEEYLAAEYFVEEARKQIFAMYGEDELYSGGLSIRTTLDTKLQLAARRALRNGLENYDRRYGWRGPIGRFEDFADWKKNLAEFPVPPDIDDWRLALVFKASKDSADLRFAPSDEKDERPSEGQLLLEDMKWAKPANVANAKEPEAVTDVLNVGDLILVQPKDDAQTTYLLRQIPEVNGSILAMDPHTGRVLAIVGGYSFNQSQFNRATQAYRQPGSAFKPFVYAAALDNGFTPASQVLDAPFVIARQDIKCDENEQGVLELRRADEDGQNVTDEASAKSDECERFYKPSNYAEGRFYGLSTLRLGLEKSRNAMTVRLANDIGMAPIMNYGTSFGIYDEVRPELAWALGAGETTMLRLATAYSMLVNGGKKVSPRLLDRVQNGAGETIFVQNDNLCKVCAVDEWDGAPPPELPDEREAVVDPVTAYQITFMLKGVVDNGTGVSIRSLGRPLGGKTGTTNDYLDAWFMGFSPDLVTGVYVGYDTPRNLNNEAGATAAAPIFKEFMGEVLKDKSVAPFRIPEGVTLSPVNRNTGEPSYIGAPEFILEAFRPGTEPKLGALSSTIRVGSGTDSYAGIGFIPSGDTAVIPEDGLVSEDGEGSIVPVEGTPQVPVPPKPKEEDELDDGLY